MFIRRNSTLPVALINAHVGLGIKHGVIQAVMKRHPGIRIILAVEVRDGAALRSALGPRWHVHPFEQPGESRAGEAMTYVCVRGQKRFEVIRGENADIRFGSQYPRRMTALVVLDRRTGRYLDLSALHPDPLGAGFVRAHPGARARHVRQVAAYVRHHAATAPEVVALSGGDTNEGIQADDAMAYRRANLLHRSALGLFETVNMYPAHYRVHDLNGPLRIIELFVRNDDYVDVTRRVAFDTGIKGMDHEVVVYWIRILKLPKLVKPRNPTTA